MTHYAWQYMHIAMSATLDGNVSVKHGKYTLTAVTQEITGFYVDLGAANSQYAYQQLIIAHRAMGAPKAKALRAYASMNQPQFTAFVEALAAAKPQADLRRLPRAEAFKQLGVADTQKLTLIALPAVVLAVMLLISAPFGVHAFDKGEQRVEVADLATARLTTRNLVITGELETQNYLEITHTKNGVKQSADYLIPVYPPGAPSDAFVPVVLKTKELSTGMLRTLAEATEWKCTLRNVLWEGLGGDDRDYFHDKLKLNVTKQTLLCEYQDTKFSSDALAFWMINGVTVVIMIAISFSIWRKRSK